MLLSERYSLIIINYLLIIYGTRKPIEIKLSIFLYSLSLSLSLSLFIFVFLFEKILVFDDIVFT